MKQKLLLALIIVIAMNFSASAQTITAVLNQNWSSTTGLSFLRTCSTSETPGLKVKLWQSGSTFTIPTDRIVIIQWWENKASGNRMLDERTVGSTQFGSATAATFDIALRDVDLQYTLSGFSTNTGNADRYSGLFFVRVKIIDVNTADSIIITSNILTIEEGTQPICTINGNYNTSNRYNVLSGCTAGTIKLQLHSSQTCGLDEFSINIWQVSRFGADVGSHYFRSLTSGEVADLIPSGSGFNIRSLNTNVAGGSNNGTITMQTNKWYVVALEYKGQHTTQVAYVTIHYKHGTWDLVMADNSSADGLAGYEPHDRWDDRVFQSPYLWNKLSTTANQNDGVHENPDYSTSNTSKMMYKIKNVGCSTSIAGGSTNGATLRLFWTRARTGDEPWNKVWIYNPITNVVKDAGGVDRPGGSEITITSPSSGTPYNTSPAPINLPAIAAGATYTVTFANGTTWYPPNPTWYDAANGSMSSDGAYPVICLLGRINELGSGIDSIWYEPTGTDDTILKYVKNNNNVATRNTWLVNSPQHIVSGTHTWHHGWASVLVTNPSPKAKLANICVDLIPDPATSGTFLSHGSIELATTTNLATYWGNGGSLASGITLNSGTLFTITNGTKACLHHIKLPGNAREQIGLRFQFNELLLPGTAKNFAYQLDQVVLDSIVGDTVSFDTIQGSDVVYLVTVPTQTLIPADALKTGIEKQHVDPLLSIYPNPSTNVFNVKMHAEAEGAELILLNANGQVEWMYKYNMQKGDITEIVDANNLAGGVYFLQFKSGDITETVKITVVH